jgi:hypothetical protein
MKTRVARRMLAWACPIVALMAFPVAAVAGTLSPSPSSSSYNTQPYFFGGQFNNFQITNSGSETTPGSATIAGPDAPQFSINGDGCANFTLQDTWFCYVGVNFNPPNVPGTFTAQLEIPSDGSPDPLVIPLSAQTLAGPAFSSSPTRIDFGSTTLGSVRSETVTITNTGDFPGAIQQAFIVGPGEFDIEDDQCSQQEMDPSEDCTLTALFAPSAPGAFQGSIFAISGTPTSPVLPINLSGEGRAAPGPGPDTKITRKPKGKVRSTTASFQFASTTPGVSFECRVDKEPFAPCTSPATYVVKRGKHLFQVRAINAAGERDATPAQVSWRVPKKRSAQKR